MESSDDLVSRLDFDLGLEFQERIRHRYKSPVHHPYSTPVGSFFLLVTFRRFLFRLTEDSVSLALQSCLGGRASDFHVQFLSRNHFRLSVFSKDVGFEIYKLRRVTTPMFDLYFHLWNNGTPHWEREKRAWEIEQEKEWTKVLSKSSKREAKKKEKDQRHVHFAKNLIQSPPKVKFLPQIPSQISLTFGAFSCSVHPSTATMKHLVFGEQSCSAPERSGASSPMGHQVQNEFPVNMAITAEDNELKVSNSILNPQNQALYCARCLVWGHSRSTCTSSVRCRRCFKLGHIKRQCYARLQPVYSWRPKSVPTPRNGLELTTHTRPVLFWRPKVFLQSAPATSHGNKPTANDESRDSRKPPASNTGNPSHLTPPPPPPPPPSNQPNENHDEESEATMANFPVDRTPFLDAIVNDANMEEPEQQPQNPTQMQPIQLSQQPQDIIDLELSESSTRFLCAPGSNMPIQLSADSEDDNSSFSNAISNQLDIDMRQRTADRLCAQQLLYNTIAIPAGFTLGAIFAEGASSSRQQQQTHASMLFKPIIIDTSPFAPQDETIDATGKEIILWSTCPDALALQAYAAMVDCQESINKETGKQQEQQSSQYSGITSGLVFETEAGESRHSPTKGTSSSPSKPKKATISLPMTASKQYPSTPLVETDARRSQRQKKAKEGYKHTWLSKNPTKRQKITALEINEKGEVGPVHTDTLRSWGLQCGIDPSDLTDEALMQVPGA